MRIGLGISLVGGQTAFSPYSLLSGSTAFAWYDPSDLSTMFQDSAGTTPVTAAGQRCKRILDKSGNSINAVQSGADSLAPTYQVDAGGRGYLSFDGVDDFLVTSTITPSANKMQVFSGLRKLSDAASFPVLAELSANSGSNSGVFLLSGRSAGAAGMLFQSKGTVVASSQNTTAAAPITQVVTGLGDISAPSSQIWTNQTATSPTTTSQGTGNYLAYPIYMGRRGGTSSSALNMWLYGLIIRFSTANLSADQVSQTQQWMATKTGVTF